jgi:hypothetical protein
MQTIGYSVPSASARSTNRSPPARAARSSTTARAGWPRGGTEGHPVPSGAHLPLGLRARSACWTRPRSPCASRRREAVLERRKRDEVAHRATPSTGISEYHPSPRGARTPSWLRAPAADHSNTCSGTGPGTRPAAPPPTASSASRLLHDGVLHARDEHRRAPAVAEAREREIAILARQPVPASLHVGLRGVRAPARCERLSTTGV